MASENFKSIPFPASNYEAFLNTEPISFTDIPAVWREELLALYDNVYPNSQWLESLENQNKIHLFVIIKNDKLAGAATLISDVNGDKYLKPAIAMCSDPRARTCQLCRVILDSNSRGKGLGKLLLKAAILNAFKQLSYENIVGTSRHANTHFLLNQFGGEFLGDDIEAMNQFISKEENYRYYEEFVSQPLWKGWKFLEGIRFSITKENFINS